MLAPWEEYFMDQIKDLPIEKAQLPDLDVDTRQKVTIKYKTFHDLLHITMMRVYLPSSRDKNGCAHIVENRSLFESSVIIQY